MIFKTKNNYIIGSAYKVNTQNSAIMVNNADTKYLIQVIASDTYKSGDILLVDKHYAEEYVISGEKYIAIESSHIIAQVQE